MSEKIINDVPATSTEYSIKAARRESLNFFWEPDHKGLWSSPNSRYLPLPVHNPSVDGDTGTIRDYFHAPRKIRWLQALQPFLAFWPRYPEWTGVFSCLNLVKGRVPVTKLPDGKWSLDGYLVTAMRVLESYLVKLGTELLRRNIEFKYEWSEIRVPSLPYQSGYERLHRTPEEAVAAGYTSRNAFVILSAFVSYAIAVDTALQPVLKDTVPSWFAYAQRNLGMDHIWLNKLKDSFVCNFTRGFRPGAYVHSKLQTYMQTLPAFTVANVPLYICWGQGVKRTWYRPDDPVLRYRPCEAEARWAKDEYTHRATGGQYTGSTSHSRQPGLGTGNSMPDTPYAGGPQLHLTRLEEDRAEAVKRGTGDAVRDREQVERSAEVERCDASSMEPRIGDSMYVWTEVGEDDFTRQGIHPTEWKNVWPHYKPEERHFSADYNEWNLFRRGDDLFQGVEQLPDDPLTTAAPPTEDELSDGDSEAHEDTSWKEKIISFWRSKYSQNDVDDEDDESDYGSEDGEVSNKRKRSGTAVGPRKRSGPQDNRTAPHLALGFTETQISDSSPLFPADSVEILDPVEVLRVKYQYRIPQPYNRHPKMASMLNPANGTTPSFPDEKNSLLRLGMETACRQDIRTGLIDFYRYFSRATQVFPPLWNLAPARRNDIVHHPYFLYHRLKSDIHIIGVRGPLALLQQWYLLVVYDARVLVELFSTPKDTPMNSINDLVRYLIGNGIPFATGKPVALVPQLLPRPGVHGLSYHPSGHEFSLEDYKEYQRRKAAILAGPAGRAAIAYGGIVWRLSVAHIPVKRLTSGPTSSVNWQGKTVATMQNRFLVDDNITPDELDIICGAYKVYTNYGAQTEDKSWFPKASIWKASGWDHGYWTADNESWYQGRLEEIKNGHFPLNAKDWREILKRRVRSNGIETFKKHVSNVCDEFLQGHSSYWLA